jgi:hypothetical protein
MYDTVEEALQKIGNTVILYQDVPVYVSTATGKKGKVKLHITKLPAVSGAEDYSIDDPGFDFKGIASRLGYTEVRNPVTDIFETVYLSRIPIRGQQGNIVIRQGLDDRTVKVDPVTDFGFKWNDLILRDSGFVNSVQDIFKTTKKAFDLITNSDPEYTSVPFHKKLALYYDTISPPYLLYRNQKIGYTEDGLVFKLARHKQYLREELTDIVGLKVA